MACIFTNDHQIFEAVIEPDRSEATKLIPRNLANELIDEVAPLAMRGKHINTISFSGGCTSIIGDEYEEVMIYRVEVCQATGEAAVDEITIRWRHRQYPHYGISPAGQAPPGSDSC